MPSNLLVQPREYQSAYVPTDYKYIQDRFDNMQQRYDATNAAQASAFMQLQEMDVATELSRQRQQELMEQLQTQYGGIESKHMGDLGRASGDVVDFISQMRKDPFWKLSQKQVEKQKEYEALATQMAAAGKTMLPFSKVPEIYNPETGQYVKAEDITFDLEGKLEDNPIMESMWNDLPAGGLAGGVKVSTQAPGYYEYSVMEGGPSAGKIKRYLEDAMTRYRETDNYRQRVKEYTQLGYTDPVTGEVKTLSHQEADEKIKARLLAAGMERKGEAMPKFMSMPTGSGDEKDPHKEKLVPNYNKPLGNWPTDEQGAWKKTTRVLESVAKAQTTSGFIPRLLQRLIPGPGGAGLASYYETSPSQLRKGEQQTSWLSYDMRTNTSAYNQMPGASALSQIWNPSFGKLDVKKIIHGIDDEAWGDFKSLAKDNGWKQVHFEHNGKKYWKNDSPTIPGTKIKDRAHYLYENPQTGEVLKAHELLPVLTEAAKNLTQSINTDISYSVTHPSLMLVPEDKKNPTDLDIKEYNTKLIFGGETVGEAKNAGEYLKYRYVQLKDGKPLGKPFNGSELFKKAKVSSIDKTSSIRVEGVIPPENDFGAIFGDSNFQEAHVVTVNGRTFLKAQSDAFKNSNDDSQARGREWDIRTTLSKAVQQKGRVVENLIPVLGHDDAVLMSKVKYHNGMFTMNLHNPENDDLLLSVKNARTRDAAVESLRLIGEVSEYVPIKRANIEYSPNGINVQLYNIDPSQPTYSVMNFPNLTYVLRAFEAMAGGQLDTTVNFRDLVEQ